MLLTITGANGVLLESGGQNSIIPLADGEREIAFEMLTSALAALAGVNPSASLCATEGCREAVATKPEQDQADHTRGVVVPLRG